MVPAGQRVPYVGVVKTTVGDREKLCKNKAKFARILQVGLLVRPFISAGEHMKTRLIDIAEAAHVSEATVSRVLAGKGGVNAATRDKVLEVARSMGRDIDALVGGESDVIGFVMPSMENPIFPQFLERLVAEATANGYDSLITTNARSVEEEERAITRLVRAGVQGIVVVSGQHANDEASLDHYRRFIQRGVRFCLVNGERDDLDASFISTDDRAAVALALKHLRDLGHERVGLAVGDEHSYPVREKVAAFEAAWPHEFACVAYTDFSYAGGYQAAIELRDQECTAIVCGSDQMAIGAIAAVRDLGLAVPRDMSVVGYDDVASAALHTPSITTIRQPLLLITRTAIRAVTGGTGSSRQAARSVFTPRPELVVRASTAPPEAR